MFHCQTDGGTRTEIVSTVENTYFHQYLRGQFLKEVHKRHWHSKE